MKRKATSSVAAREVDFLASYEQLVLEYNQRLSAQFAKETSFCKAGCANCCSQLFSLNTAHVDLIVRRLQNNRTLLAAVRKNIAARKAQIAKLSGEISELNGLKGVDDHAFSLGWLKLKIPCAFLIDDKCSIYDIRPMVCATYISLAPPRVCAIDPKGYLPLSMARIKSDFIQAITNLCHKHKIRLEMRTDLSAAIEERLEHDPESENEKE